METPAGIDKSKWGEGPWQTEPDRMEFEYEGFPCLIVRHQVYGNFCGYVAMPPGHPWHGDWPTDVAVHGGITFASGCSGGICHVPKPGQPDDVWWLGFDCGHAGIDRQPAMDALLVAGLPEEMRINLMEGKARLFGVRETYKDLTFVRDQCERLAEQAKEVAGCPVCGGAASFEGTTSHVCAGKRAP